MRIRSCEEFIYWANKVHGLKYDYSKVIYKKSYDKFEIVCPKHGSFYQTLSNHIHRHHGCPKCSSWIGTRTQSSFINDAKILHGDSYDYASVTYNKWDEKINIICKKHGSFWQTPNNHLHGRGCPKCRYSNGERNISKYLDSKNIIYEHQKTFADCKNPKTNYKLRYDFYIPSKNLLIEYDGPQHFTLGRWGKFKNMTTDDLEILQFRDLVKSKYAKTNNIRLLRINYKDIKRIPEILPTFI